MAAPSFQTIGTENASASTSCLVDAPAGVVAGEIVIISLLLEPSTATITATPANFTQDSRVGINSSGSFSVAEYVFWKRALGDGTDDDTDTYDFTLAGGLIWRQAVAMRFSGCIASGSPIDTASASNLSAANAGPPAASLTTSVNDTLLLWIACEGAGITAVAPSGFTSRLTSFSNSGHHIATNPQAVFGGTGSITSSTTTSSNWLTWLGALLPVATAASPLPIPNRPMVLRPTFRRAQQFFDPGSAAAVSPAVYIDDTLTVPVRRAGFY